jgi:hypothetical protein
MPGERVPAIRSDNTICPGQTPAQAERVALFSFRMKFNSEGCGCCKSTGTAIVGTATARVAAMSTVLSMKVEVGLCSRGDRRSTRNFLQLTDRLRHGFTPWLVGGVVAT